MKTYLFPGQGSQYIGMGGESLFDSFSELTLIADEILGYSIKELCLKDPAKQLAQTKYTQPALYVVNALSYRQRLREQELPPNFVAGHSLGEYNALESANVMDFEDGLKLVKKRSELMSEAPRGAMAAIIGLTVETIRKILIDNQLFTIDIANYNSATQIVISGIESDIYNAQPIFEKYKAMYVPLNVTGAFHSRYMQIAHNEFRKFLADFEFSEPVFSVIANINAKPYVYDTIKENLSDQLIHPVRWLDSMKFLFEQNVTEFIEIGPGDVLSKLIDNIRDQYFSIKLKQPELTTQATISKIISPKEKVDNWNLLYKIGTKVSVKNYEQILETKTEALLLFGHRAAIYLQGYNGYFALDDIVPITDNQT